MASDAATPMIEWNLPLCGNPECFLDRSEIWFACSTDGGHTWSEPQFVFATALAPSFDNTFRNYKCSYMDAVIEEGAIHLSVPQRWERVLHLRLSESSLDGMLPQENLG